MIEASPAALASPEPGASASPSAVPSVEPSPTPRRLGGLSASLEPFPSVSLASPSPSAVPSAVPSTPPLASEPPAASAPAASPGSGGKPKPTAPVLTPGPERGRALAKTEVFGFLPYWELPNADTLDLDEITTLAWFGVEAGARGALLTGNNGKKTPGWAGWTSDAWKALQAKAQAADVRVVLTIQRFSWTSGQRSRTIKLLKDPVARMRLASQSIDAIRDAGADGLNLDFEPMPAEVSDEFTQLVRELRAAMNAVDPKLQLTFDVMPGVEGYDIAALTADDAADAMFVMGYEYRTGNSARSGSNAPLVAADGFDLTTSVENILTRVQPGRVILGLQWYGRAWSTVSRQPHAETRSGARWPQSVTINYDDAIIQAARTGRFYDDVEESAWTVYPSKVDQCNACRVTWRQLWYDDVDATRAKVEFALGKELRGVGFWALGYQGGGSEMWSVLRLTVGGEKDKKAPTGEAKIDPGYQDGQRNNLPIVGRRVRLLTSARDGENGSGVAYVRVASSGGVDRDGKLSDGTTYQAAGSVLFDVLTGGPVYDLPLPRAGRPRETELPAASEAPSPAPSLAPSLEPSVEPSAVPSASPQPGASASPEPGASGLPPASAMPSAVPSPSVEPSIEPTDPPEPIEPSNVKAGRQVIRIQWRDVAGNWSEPVSIPVWFKPSAKPKATSAPEPTPDASEAPPFVPGESPGADASEIPEPSDPPMP